MEVSTNVSQSLALAAYSAQQQQAVSQPRNRESDTQSVDANSGAENRRGDTVNFSSEALRLSSQNVVDTSRNTVNRSNESEAANQQQQQNTPPEVTRAEGAKSIAQAINSYRSTSVI